MENKQRGYRFYLRFFWETFSLSAFTFGGGYVIVPLMRKRFVEENHWLEDEEMLDIVAISQSAPGIIAVNASILVGYRLSGVLGSILAVVATVLPPLIIISIIALFYQSFRDNAVVAAMLRAMESGVAAVIVDAVLKMGATAAKNRGLLAPFVMLACFAASFFLGINVALIILFCGVLGAVSVLVKKRGRGQSKNGGAS